MSTPRTVSDLPKPRLDDYRPLDLFLEDEEGEVGSKAESDMDSDEAIATRLLDTSPSGLAAFHFLVRRFHRTWPTVSGICSRCCWC